MSTEEALAITYLVTPVAQIAIIMGLAEVAKKLGLKSKFVPIFDVVVGVASGLVVYSLYQGKHPVEGVILGFAMGLTACGLFSGVKNVTE